MKYLDEYRDAQAVKSVLAQIEQTVSRPWTLMEVCGGQTHSIIRHGLDKLLPPQIELVHGPGCPVCVTSLALIDKAIALAGRPDVIFTSYGDLLLVNGTLGDHGIAIMSLREGLEFETQIVSDSAPLNGLVAGMLLACPDIHVLRDLTRGGLAAAANEIARASSVSLVIEEQIVPVQPAVQSACEILGFDPLYVANEGKLLAIVPPYAAESVLEAMRRHPLGLEATCIGQVTADHPGVVIGQTAIGSQRVIDLPAGELLPRIC
jgi:hydrogenase expression/formation protein HypE